MKLQVKAPGSSHRCLPRARATKAPNHARSSSKNEHQKSDNREKIEKTYTVTSPGEIVNVDSHSAIFDLVTIPLGRHLGLAGISWLRWLFGGGSGKEERKKKE